MTRRYLVAAVLIGVGSTLSMVAQAVLLGMIVQRALVNHYPLDKLTPLIVGLGGAFGARAVLSWGGELAAHRTSAQVTSTLRRQLLAGSIALGPSWLSRERTGELVASATQGIDALDVYFARYLPTAVLAALAPICVLSWILWLDWSSFVILAVTVSVVPLFMILLGLEAKRQAQDQWAHLSGLAATFFDLLKGLPTLRAFNRAPSGRRTLEVTNNDFRLSTMSTLRIAFLSSMALEILASVGTALVALVLGLRLLDGTVQLGLALAVLVLAPEVYLPLRRAGAEFHASAEGQAAAGRILDLLDEAESATTSPGADPGSRPPACPVVSRSVIEASGVVVRYPGRSVPVLAGLDLVVAPGEHLAVTGESGSGKSTLLSVLLGFVEPDSGTLTVGGIHLRRLSLRAWRRQIAWVPQRPYLIDGTIADNLRLGDPNADSPCLMHAVELSGLSELVARLPRGIETKVGEGGLTLSAGERQRVALGRAVMRDASLILLDEPAAHLDAARETSLCESLGPWLESRTVVLAAHQGGLVGRVDRSVVLVGGQLIEVPAASCQLTQVGVQL
ncbi:MAG: thiol reductant ABC exporter subunit CydD [Acidimicrobiales bacterium]